MSNKLLLTGAAGQLGTTIQLHWPQSALANSYQLHCCDVSELDLTDKEATEAYLDALAPDIVINAAAYTAVDQAEQEPELAFEGNEKVVQHLANWCRFHESKLIQISTDFVFSGTADSPYGPEAKAEPLSVYGSSKRAGEKQLLNLLPDRSAIIRTSWLYSEFGNNFVITMLRLMAEKPELGIVADQIGSPTSAHSLAQVVFRIIELEEIGIFHWSDGGQVSWYEFAEAIQAISLEYGILETAIPLKRLTTAEYPTPAARPAYSVMDLSKTLQLLKDDPLPWQEELRKVIAALRKH